MRRSFRGRRKRSSSRNRVGWPNAPDLDTTVTPSQAPPRRRDTGTPGSNRPCTSRLGGAERQAQAAQGLAARDHQRAGWRQPGHQLAEHAADAAGRVGARGARRHGVGGERHATVAQHRLQGGRAHGAGVVQRGPMRQAGGQLGGGDRLVAAEQAQDGARQDRRWRVRRRRPGRGPARRCRTTAQAPPRPGQRPRQRPARHPSRRRTRSRRGLTRRPGRRRPRPGCRGRAAPSTRFGPTATQPPSAAANCWASRVTRPWNGNAGASTA